MKTDDGETHGGMCGEEYSFFIAGLRAAIEERKRGGDTQKGIAERAGVSAVNMSKVLGDKAGCSASWRSKVCAELATTEADLVEKGRCLRHHPEQKAAAPDEATAPSPADTASGPINVHQGVVITTKVLSSGTGYAKALWENLKSFEAAVDKEVEVASLKEDVREMKEMMKKMVVQLQCRRATDMPGEDD